MRYIYSLLLYLLTPYLFLRLWWKGRRLPAYRQRVLERFCLNRRPLIEVDIWVHAVSLGEVIAAIPLIDALLAKQWSVLVTTMTPTGAERVQARFGDRVKHQYVPYDLPDVVQRFFKRTKARLGIIVETELWPNLISQATKAHIPLLLVNARLSERSCQGYRKVRFLFQPLLNQFNAILAQSEDDAKRFISLGANEKKVTAYGNMKFDLQTQHIDSESMSQLKRRWGVERTVMILASTHEDEEQVVLSQLPKLQQAIPHLILLIAPRHPERFAKVYQLSIQLGFNTGLRSQDEALSPANEVVILDSLGELLGFYQISDYAFVGGSFVPVGGHNVLEPIAMQVPVFSGPHVHNFKTICRDLQEAKAIEMVENVDELFARVISLYQDEKRKKVLVENATRVLKANKGAVERYVDRVSSIL